MINTDSFTKIEHYLEEFEITVKDPVIDGVSYSKKIKITSYAEPNDNSYYVEKATGKKFKSIPTEYVTNIDDNFNFHPEGFKVTVDIDNLFERVYYGN